MGRTAGPGIADKGGGPRDIRCRASLIRGTGGRDGQEDPQLRNPAWARIAAGLVLPAMMAGASGPALAQPQLNPVYVDDSPVASDTLSRVRDHLSGGNVDEAVRVLQALLDDHPDRLAASLNDADVFVSVRARVNDVLLADPALLRRYRSLQGPRAAAILDAAPHALSGAVDQVERSFLLTTAGMDAALRVAQRQIEDARFEAARITLEQLERHPDRASAAPTAREAAGLLSTAARFIDRPEVFERAARWLAEAGRAEAPGTRATWPPDAVRPGLSPLSSLPPLDTAGLIAKPLWTIDLRLPSITDPNTAFGNPRLGGPSMANIPITARELTMLPTVTDDLVIVNDGSSVTAWDRFTLSARWTVQATPSLPKAADEDSRNQWRNRMWGSAASPEPATVTVVGPYAAAATGRAQGAGRDGDDRLLGIDPRTGRLLWSVSLAELDPTLSESAIRGPVEIREGTVVAAVRKTAHERRLVSLSMIGVDAENGRLKWSRPIGSAGWLPFASQSFGPAAITVDRGMAYRTDELGAVAAVEIDSGRTRWVRRMPVETGASPSPNSQSWQVNRPLMDNGSIIIITPDGRRLARVDSMNGSVLAERPGNLFGDPPPSYLLRVGQQLAAVSANRIAFTPIAAFDVAPVRLTPQIEDPGIRGRVSVVGDKLLTPLARGLALIDPAAPDADPLTQPLDKPGNVLAVGSQLLVVDDLSAHSYLQWGVAEGILQKRMAADPRDPTPAVTFAELAYRAGKFDRVGGAVDAALSAIATDPAADRNILQRQRLFETMHAMIGAGLEAAEASLDVLAEAARPGELPRLTDRSLLGSLIDKLGRAAGSPDDRVAVALASGRLSELGGDATAAAAVYQRILDDPAMATANWRGRSVSVRAEIEAARRLEHLITVGGPMIYAAQEAECERRLLELGDGATIQQLEQLAARFPLSVRTPELFARIADLHRGADRSREAVAALESGLKAAQRIPNAPESVVGELAGRLVLALRERQQPAAAAASLRTIRRRMPALTLTSGGEPLDADRLGAELAERIALTTRWPRIGPLTGENVQVLSGWGLMSPWLQDFSPHVAGCLVMYSDREVGVWVVNKDGPEAGRLGKLWSRRVEDGSAELLRITPDAAYVLLTGDRSGGLEKVPLAPGVRGWKTTALARLFPPSDESRGMQRAPGVMQPFDTPDDGVVRPDDLLPVMDEQTLALVQRGGRTIAIDCESGEVLWHADTGISQVYDAHLSGGTLVVAGDVRRTTATGALEPLIPSVQMLDARAGRMGQRLRDLGARPGDGAARLRWVRLTDAGALICGTDNAVLSIDLATTQRNWTITSAEMLPAAAAWIFGDRLLMLSADRELWLASLSTGRVRSGSLEAPRSRLESTREVAAFTTTANADGPFAVTTYHGLMIFNADGELHGIDGLGAVDTMLPPLPAEDRALALETVAEGRGADGLLQFHLYALDNKTGALSGRHALSLATRPQAAAIIDGKFAVSAGSATIVIEAPPAK